MRAPLTPLTRVTPYILFVLEFLYLAYIHSWEVDPHHDGIMYTAAVGAYEGKVPNRDFFAQYGPISPIIQGLWFRLTEPTVWSLKLLTSLGLAVIGVLIYMGSKRRLSIQTSVLLSICWVLSGPFGLPWSSVFSTIFILVSLLLLETIFSAPFHTKSRYYALLAGVLLAVGTFTRIHTLLVYCAIALGLLALKDKSKHQSIVANLSMGYFLTFGSIILVLEKIGAFPAYINQCILWAGGRYAGGPELSVSFFFNLAWIPIYGLINLLILLALARDKKLKIFSTLKIVVPSIILYSTLVLFSQLHRSGPETLRNPRILSIIAGQKAQFSFNFLVLTFFVVLVFYALFNSLERDHLQRLASSNSKIVYCLLALATLTQLYPYTDEYHIAFVVPVILVACIFSFPHDFNLRWNQMAFSFLALVLIPTLVAHSLILANVERVEFKSKTLAGMYGSWQSSGPLDISMLKLENELPGIRFICADGLYAGAGGRYLSVDEKFVTWGPLSTELIDSDREFVCSADQKLIASYLDKGWKLKFKVLLPTTDGNSNISHWNVLFEKTESLPTEGG